MYGLNVILYEIQTSKNHSESKVTLIYIIMHIKYSNVEIQLRRCLFT